MSLLVSLRTRTIRIEGLVADEINETKIGLWSGFEVIFWEYYIMRVYNMNKFLLDKVFG